MNLSQDAIQQAIAKVLAEMAREQTVDNAGRPAYVNGIFNSVDQAVECAVQAQKRLVSMSLESRHKVIDAIRQAALVNNEELCRLAVEETGLGRVEDKFKENELCAKYTPGPEDLTQRAFSGDDGLTLLEHAPVGVIGALTPVTNSTGTLINNTISMVSAGNAVVYNCHPSAKLTTQKVIRLFNKAITQAGAPEGLVNAIAEPTLETANELMSHPKVNMLVATGGPHVVKAVLSSGKKAIGAGAGNPPALVDETAIIRKAAEDIVAGHSINNNIFCISEKEVVVVDEVAGSLLKFMGETGKAKILTPDETAKVEKAIFKEDGSLNPSCIGKNIQKILQKAGIDCGENLRCAVFEAAKDHPLVWKEQMMPVLPVVRVKDVWEGIELAVELEQGNRHTATMHSTNVAHLTAFARAVQTTIFVKNGPSYAGLGLGGEGYPSFTIAGPTGEGITTAKNFTRERRCTLVEGFRII